MSTLATSTPTNAGVIDISDTAPVPFGTLVKVELRKMLDTRSGKWLLISTGLLLVAVTAVVLIVLATSDSESLSYGDWLQSVLLTPMSILIPVFPILCITAEWTQRTGLGTFTLEANRPRLVMAKLVAVAGLALLTLVFAAVLGVAGNAIGAGVGGYSADWAVDGEGLFWNIVAQVLFFLMAFGIGSVLLSSAGAVSVFYVVGLMVPFIVYFGLVASFEWASNIIPFFDLQTSSAQLAGGEQIYLGQGLPLEAKQYWQFASAAALWVVLPLLLGFRRIMRTEIK